MDLTFGNPAGFWALLGVPAIVAIHFLQRRSRVLMVTTLFLLEQMRRESETGHRFERLRSSIPLWLQLLMVLLMTWLLVHPRWLRTGSVQRLAVVLDASASMQAFREQALKELAQQLDGLAGAAASTEYTLLTSEPEAVALYHGTSLPDAMAAASSWQPVLGAHDVAPALRTARSLVGEGVIIFVTDQAATSALPSDAKRLAVGEPRENCGFSGVSIDEADGQFVFKVLVQNHSRTRQQRRWWIDAGGRRTEPATIELNPNETRTLQATFPANADKCTLELAADTLTIDDRLPLIRPRPKLLFISLPAGGEAARTLEEVFRAFPRTEPAASRGSADLVAVIYNPLAPALPDGHACVFAADPQPGANYAAGAILAEQDPLLDGLNFQGLLVRETLGIPRLKDDRVLLWQGERPLVIRRITAAGHEQLLFNFDLESTNARRLPAFAVLLHRFLENLRRIKIAPEAANFEANQLLRLSYREASDASPLELVALPLIAGNAQSPSNGAPPRDGANSQSSPTIIPPAQGALLRAPKTPAFFTVRQGDVMLLDAAAHFADARESDLTAASAQNEVRGLETALVERNSEADSHWRLWTLLVLAALLASWWFARGRRRDLASDAAPSPS
jgi:hypothetical protein